MTARQTALDQTIGRYYDECARDPDGRDRSWEHCYRFFRKHRSDLLEVERDAALQLGFYLASWGMYRGSAFLLQHTYTVHIPVIRALASSQFTRLWQVDVGTNGDHIGLASTIMDVVDSVKAAYKPFGNATDTLATKVLLGTIGCLPALDRLFIDGFRERGFPYSRLNGLFVGRILRFSIDHRRELAKIQSEIMDRGGLRYPLMKLVDMHFWQIGADLEST
ncbi:hypothetical protein [Candidatus Palauibacter sp.]|uniref:hypothetical protein n=1 Tax=Candidatus Palauibacter sp. TaxID=3101350 RepID=UPI003AF2606D